VTLTKPLPGTSSDATPLVRVKAPGADVTDTVAPGVRADPETARFTGPPPDKMALLAGVTVRVGVEAKVDGATAVATREASSAAETPRLIAFFKRCKEVKGIFLPKGVFPLRPVATRGARILDVTSFPARQRAAVGGPVTGAWSGMRVVAFGIPPEMVTCRTSR
jgi:hypothetical protein